MRIVNGVFLSAIQFPPVVIVYIRTLIEANFYWYVSTQWGGGGGEEGRKLPPQKLQM